jgi:hypothetical protein
MNAIKLRHLTALCLMMLTFSSCKTGNSVLYSVANILGAPFDFLGTGINAITGNTYGSLKENTRKVRSEQSLFLQCQDSGVKLGVANFDELESLQSRIRDTTCSCVAWGTCSNTICSCDILCPWSFDILKRPPVSTLNDYSGPDHSVPFLNTASSFPDEDPESFSGYCTGIAAITQSFNRMAFFDASARPPYSLTSSDEDEKESAVDYYRDLIQEIRYNRATTIPGFRNLGEFAAVPEIQELITDAMAHAWADLNNRPSTWFPHISQQDGSQTVEDRNSVIDDIIERVDNHQQPMTNIYSNDGSFHTFLITSHGVDSNGNKYLCARDNNSLPIINVKCTNKLYIKKDKLMYKNWDKEISDIHVYPLEDSRTVEQVNSLRDRCENDKDC